jgi:hypothetical protein
MVGIGLQRTMAMLQRFDHTWERRMVRVLVFDTNIQRVFWTAFGMTSLMKELQDIIPRRTYEIELFVISATNV